MKILFHLVIFDYILKEKIKEMINKKFILIDLDEINLKVINHENFIKNYKKFITFKDKKNDNYKNIDKKLTEFWEKKFIELIKENIPEKKKVILLGKCHHYRLINKKIDFKCNKFILDEDLKKTTKHIIKKNLDDNYNNIISGAYLLENIDYQKIKKKITNIYESYLKDNFIKKNLEEIESIISMSNDKNNNTLWISMKDDYKINSLIHPINKDIYAFSDPIFSLLSSINFDNSLDKYFNDNKIKIKINDEKNCKDKLSTKRYIYMVDNNNFIPFEKGKKLKYFSQSPVKILDKEIINNVYDKFKELKLL